MIELLSYRGYSAFVIVFSYQKLQTYLNKSTAPRITIQYYYFVSLLKQTIVYILLLCDT